MSQELSLEYLHDLHAEQTEILIQINTQLKGLIDRQTSLINHLSCLYTDYSKFVGELHAIHPNVVIDRLRNCASAREDHHQNILRIVD